MVRTVGVPFCKALEKRSSLQKISEGKFSNPKGSKAFRNYFNAGFHGKNRAFVAKSLSFCGQKKQKLDLTAKETRFWMILANNLDFFCQKTAPWKAKDERLTHLRSFRRLSPR